MLVITLKEGESVYVGDSIIVKFVAYEDRRIRIGFEAPKSVNIVRKNQVLDKSKNPGYDLSHAKPDDLTSGDE